MTTPKGLGHLSDELLWRVLKITTAITTLISSVGLVSNLVHGNFVMAGLEFFRGLGIISIYLYTKRRNNVFDAIGGVILFSWFVFAVLLVASGGVGSLYLYWLIILPSMALMMNLKKMAVSMAVGTLILVLALSLYDGTGAIPSIAQPEGMRRGFSAVLSMGVMMLTALTTVDLMTKLDQENLSKQAEHEKKQNFFIHINHEIRNPLNALIASVEMLGRDMDRMNINSSDPIGFRLKKVMQSMHATSEHILSIVNDVLEVEKLLSADAPENSTSFSIKDLAEDVVSIFAAKSALSGVDIQARYKAGIDESWIGNEARIRQVLLNLTSNALQHSGGKKILITISDYSCGLSLEVKDDGKGIDEAFLSSIFNPFSTSVIGEGFSGLGLGICKILVEKKMGGTIEVTSQKERGTSFLIKIPIKSNGSPERFKYVEDERRASRIALKNELKNLSLLLVEDNDENGQVMEMLLENAGFRVGVAKTAQQAITMANGVEVFLIDLNLGQNSISNGIELTREISNHGGSVIGFTGNSSVDIKEMWLAAGAKLVLNKPVSIDAILAAVERVVLQDRVASDESKQK